MLTIQQLKSLVKKQAQEVFAPMFEIRIAHPYPDAYGDTHYSRFRTYVKADILRRIFESLFKEKKLRFNLSRKSTWVEMYLIMLEIRQEEDPKAKGREFLIKNSELNIQNRTAFAEFCENQNLKVESYRARIFTDQGYPERFSIPSLNLEVAYCGNRFRPQDADYKSVMQYNECSNTFALLRDGKFLEKKLSLKHVCNWVRVFSNNWQVSTVS